MQSAKRYLLIALSFALALTVFAVFTPKIAHAITATLVQVVNTASNPVPTVSVNSRKSVSLSNSISDSIGGSSGVSIPLDDADGNLYVVPQGERLVIDSVTGSAKVAHGVTPIESLLDVRNTSTVVPVGTIHLSPHFDGTDGSNTDYYSFAQNVTAYAAPGTYLNFSYTRYPSNGPQSVSVQVFAHLEDASQ